MTGIPVTQLWTHELSFMQQSVLITAIRGPDGLPKQHVSKYLIRWLRRCVMICAFDGESRDRPFNTRHGEGGSFTGPSCSPPDMNTSWQDNMNGLLKEYIESLDAVPHHFQLHLLHAMEILGYKYPLDEVREWWHEAYLILVNDLHLLPEPEAALDKRLGDSMDTWLGAQHRLVQDRFKYIEGEDD